MSSRKTRRSSSAQGTRESGGRGGLLSGRGVDVGSRGGGAATGQAGGGGAGGTVSLGVLEGGPEDAVVAHEVRARRWNQRGETAQQLARLQDEDLAAGAEAALHAIGELAVGKRGEALLREGRPGPMAAQVSQALPVVRVQMDTGVQRKALAVRGERAPPQELLRSKGALPIGPLTVVEGGEGAPARRAGLPPQRFASADPVSSCPRHGLWQIPNPGLTLVRNIS